MSLADELRRYKESLEKLEDIRDIELQKIIDKFDTEIISLKQSIKLAETKLGYFEKVDLKLLGLFLEEFLSEKTGKKYTFVMDRGKVINNHLTSMGRQYELFTGYRAFLTTTPDSEEPVNTVGRCGDVFPLYLGRLKPKELIDASFIDETVRFSFENSDEIRNFISEVVNKQIKEESFLTNTGMQLVCKECLKKDKQKIIRFV